MKATAKKTVTCMDCMKAMLHRYGNNPILAACQAQPQPGNEKFPFAVEVASCQRICVNYIFSDVQKQVIQRIPIHGRVV